MYTNEVGSAPSNSEVTNVCCALVASSWIQGLEGLWSSTQLLWN